MSPNNTLPTYEIADEAIITELPHLTGQPEGRTFSLIEKGLPQPSDGAGYIVESVNDSDAVIVAYLDTYGRVFETNAPVTIPPARYAKLTLDLDPDATLEQQGIFIIDTKGEPHLTAHYQVEHDGDKVTYAITKSPVNTDGLNPSPYAFFIAQAYALLYYYPRLTGYQIVQLYSAEALQILDQLDPFEAINRFMARYEEVTADPYGSVSPLVTWLATLLNQTGMVGKTIRDMKLPDDPELPEIRLIRTTEYAGTFYILMETERLSAENEQKLLQVEGILNRFFFMAGCFKNRDQESEFPYEQLDNIEAEVTISALPLLINDQRKPFATKDFEIRQTFAKAIENLRFWYRVRQQFRINPANGCAAISAHTVSSNSMLLGTSSQNGEWAAYTTEEHAEYEMSYLCLVAVLMAATLFGETDVIHTAYVTMYRTSDNDELHPVLSVAFTRDEFIDLIRNGYTNPEAIISEFPDKTYIEDIMDKTASIEPICDIHSELFCPPENFVPFQEKLPDYCLNDDEKRILAIDNIRDLNIFEEAPRTALANRIIDALDISTEKAYEVTHDIHDQSEDLSIRRVCQEIMQGFENHQLDEMSFLEIKEAFKDLYGFQDLFMQYSTLPDTNPDAKRAALGRIIETQKQNHLFEDTDTVCYRYFESFGERVIYERLFADGRKVMLIPDELYAAYSITAFSYCESFEAGEKGLPHAEECIRMAPTNADGYRHTGRIYFMLGDFKSEIEECKKMLRISTHPSNQALAFYWMGFAYWKIGNPVMGAICYRRCAHVDGTYRQEALAELDELLQENPHIVPLSRKEEDNEMRHAGIPIDDVYENARFLLQSAEIATNAGQYKLAQGLIATSAQTTPDDALYQVLNSLNE